VVTLYLLPDLNVKLMPQLEKMKPGTRIVSHDFDMRGAKPDQKVTLRAKDDFGNEREHTIYLWTIPLKKEKTTDDEPEEEEEQADKEPDVIFVPTPQGVVDKMLELAEVKKGDVVYDLGCGDGRIVVTAAKKFGVKATGFDVDPQRIKESTANVKKNEVGDLVTIKKQDIFTLDLAPASVVTLYLLPDLNVKLIPQLEKMKPGSRIVSHDFAMRGVKPDKTITIRAKNDYGTEREHTIYLWTIPLKKEKASDNEE
jgi:SAM-dependent methyltransferase